MKNFILAAVAVAGLGLSTLVARAEDEKKAESWTGALIDNHCGEKKDEAAALKHPAACACKEACAASGYQLVVGDKHYKFDDKGNEKAKAFMEKADKDNTSTKVVVEGKMDGEKLEVTSIKEALSK